MKIYDFTVKKRDGSELDLSELKGKVVLVDPLFAFLKKESPEEDAKGMKNNLSMKAIEKISKTFLKPDDIKWNFTKFLIDRDGNIVGRFAPTVKPEDLESEVEKII